jgi:hypothetical protein
MSSYVVRMQFVLILSAHLATQCTAGITQVVLFTGFGAGSAPSTGMGQLSQYLSTTQIPDYLGRVFEWTQLDEASVWVEQHAFERTTLVLIGHSFGGNSILQLADNYLSPLHIDLTVQIDPVKNLLSGANDLLPGNVEVGFNYYQISTGFLEPQGEDFVTGATNINVEVLFNDTSITHTSIDNDTRLYARIAQNILANLNPTSADFDNDGDVDGRDFLVWQQGGSPNPLSGDDLSLWNKKYGSGEFSAVVVPEPNSFMAITVIVCAVAQRNTSALLRRASTAG